MSEIIKKYRVLKAVAIDGIVGVGTIVEISETQAANIGIGEYLEEVTEEKSEEVPEVPQVATVGEGDASTEEKSEEGEVKAESSEEVSETIKHVVTQEDLDANPALVESGAQVGDEIELPNPSEDGAAKDGDGSEIE